MGREATAESRAGPSQRGRQRRLNTVADSHHWPVTGKGDTEVPWRLHVSSQRHLYVCQTMRAIFDGCWLTLVLVMLSLAGGIGLMIAILARYIQSRRQLVSWGVEYGNRSASKGSGQARNSNSLAPPPQHHGVYDPWLMTRFTIAFVVMGYVILLVVI